MKLRYCIASPLRLHVWVGVTSQSFMRSVNVRSDGSPRSSCCYSVEVTEHRGSEALRAGLCASCEFVQRITSDRGSIFYLCQKSFSDPAFVKYPRLPVLRCSGYTQRLNQQEGSE